MTDKSHPINRIRTLPPPELSPRIFPQIRKNCKLHQSEFRIGFRNIGLSSFYASVRRWGGGHFPEGFQEGKCPTVRPASHSDLVSDITFEEVVHAVDVHGGTHLHHSRSVRHPVTFDHRRYRILLLIADAFAIANQQAIQTHDNRNRKL